MPIKQMKIPTLMTIMALSLTACKDEETNAAAAQQAQGIPIRVEAPQTRVITEWQEFTGRFQAQQRVEVRARVSGYLEAIKFEDGQMVEKGDVLFVIDQRPFKIALASAQARFDAANNEYKRSKGLRKSKAISEEDYDERLQAMRIAKADLDQAKLNLDFTEVKAPFSGRISNNRIDVGNIVNGEAATNATLLTTIVSVSPIEMYFDVSETDVLNHLRNKQNGTAVSDRGRGLPIFAKLQDENDFLHEGTINFADNELSADTGTILVRAIFDNTEGLFEPGMFARLRIAQGAASEKIIIPQNVIGTEMTRKYVYTLDEQNKAQRKYLQLGTITADNMQIIRSGISTNDKIAVGGLHMIQPGALIAPIEAAAQPQNEATEAPTQEAK